MTSMTARVRREEHLERAHSPSPSSGLRLRSLILSSIVETNRNISNHRRPFILIIFPFHFAITMFPLDDLCEAAANSGTCVRQADKKSSSQTSPLCLTPNSESYEIYKSCRLLASTGILRTRATRPDLRVLALVTWSEDLQVLYLCSPSAPLIGYFLISKADV